MSIELVGTIISTISSGLKLFGISSIPINKAIKNPDQTNPIPTPFNRFPSQS